MSAPVSNPWEDAARAEKAGRIAAVLARQGLTAAQVNALDADGRRAAERLARVRPASDATWEIVARLVDPALASDPFAGWE
jgi:hypothetical protein